MNYRTNRAGIVLTAVLIGSVAVGCVSQPGNPDNIPGVPTAAVNKSTPTPAPSAGAMNDVAGTWSQVEEARSGLDSAVKAKEMHKVHEAASKISDLVKTLPNGSSMLPEDKRKTLDAHVENVESLAASMQKLNTSGDMQSVQEHQAAMNDALEMMKGIYPAEVMQSAMHVPGTNPSGKGMAGMGDDKMGAMPPDTTPHKGKTADPGKGMPDDKMGGMGMGMMDKMMPGMANDKMSDKPMPGKPMPADMTTMDKMTSGMSGTDKNEMKMMMDKLAAMPPAQRKKAMQKMSGMGKPAADKGKQTNTDSMPMPSGGSGGGMGDM